MNVLFVPLSKNSLNLFHSEFDFSTSLERENCQVSDLCDARGALHMLYRGRFQFLKVLKNLVSSLLVPVLFAFVSKNFCPSADVFKEAFKIFVVRDFDGTKSLSH